MIHDVVFFSSVAPGPACRIPDDKKIFRVTQDGAAALFASHPSLLSDCDATAEGAPEAVPLPVPHMYSA